MARALVDLGAERVVQVGEPKAPGVASVHAHPAQLPFRNDAFHFVWMHAFLHRVPRPRLAWIRELWRVVRPGGVLAVTGSPNLYLPRDPEATGLWWVPWMPMGLAHRYARLRGAFDGDRSEWEASGWRGVGHYELMGPLRREIDRSDARGVRGALLGFLGVPPILLDPFPRWLLQKEPEPIRTDRPEVRLPGTGR